MAKPIKHFVPKQDQRLPDAWGVTVDYQDGSKTDSFDGTHRVIDVLGEKILEIYTSDDECVLIPVVVIKKISLDKRFCKAAAISRELAAKAAKEAEAKKS